MDVEQRFGNIFVICGQRQNSFIIHNNDGFYYHRHHDEDRPNSMFVTLRCVRRTRRINPCYGTALVSRDGLQFHVTNYHNGHRPDPVYSEELRLRHRILSAVRNGDPRPFSVIIRNAGLQGAFSMEARSRLVRARLRTSLRNARIGLLPPIPPTLLDLIQYLMDPRFAAVCQTLDDNDNLFAGHCGNFHNGTISVVLASQRQLGFLQNSRIVSLHLPMVHSRNVHCILNAISCSTYLPLGTMRTRHQNIVLMQSRTGEAYQELFSFLKTLIPGWNPLVIMCDHEVAQVNEWRRAFPNALISTCLYHFAVAVLRHAKSIGLGTLMRECWMVDQVIRCLCVLPLLPSQYIQYGLFSLGIYARMTAIMRSPLVRSMFTYMETQWVPKIHYLSVYGIADRTNNVSESVNAALALEIRENRPNMWMLLEAFKRLEDQSVVDLHALQSGRNAQRCQVFATLFNDFTILNLTDSFLNGNINILDFLIQSSKSLQAPYEHIFP